RSDDRKADGELGRVAEFATRMMRRYPRAAIDGAFAVRVAEADLELGDDASAERLARQALRMNVKEDIRAEALWVQGVAQYRLGEQKAARDMLTRLVAENPNNRYTEGARANLAMLLEDMGDLNGALEQYLALDYRFDTAYFVDVLMATDQVAGFVEAHRAIPQYNEVLYGGGLRYLRDGRWDDARRVLDRDQTIGRGADDNYRFDVHKYYLPYERARWSPKKEYNPEVKGIRHEWVDQDLQTADDMQRLEREAKMAQGDEARAEALYQLA